jgi:hypothetical protein
MRDSVSQSPSIGPGPTRYEEIATGSVIIDSACRP